MITVSAGLLRELVGGWAEALGAVTGPDYMPPWRVESRTDDHKPAAGQ
jgi:hypothetical protein